MIAIFPRRPDDFRLRETYCTLSKSQKITEAKMANTPTGLESQIRSGKILPQMSFAEKVWAMTARIPRGKVVTYADLAKSLKSTGYRAVGQALHRNPYAPGVPCHRVVGSDGRLTGYAHGIPKKRKMLEQEGVRFDGDRIDLEICGTTIS
jgi:methylated-DNA-[protein]-cysteine S-methyltransferase